MTSYKNRLDCITDAIQSYNSCIDSSSFNKGITTDISIIQFLYSTKVINLRCRPTLILGQDDLNKDLTVNNRLLQIFS